MTREEPKEQKLWRDEFSEDLKMCAMVDTRTTAQWESPRKHNTRDIPTHMHTDTDSRSHSQTHTHTPQHT